MNALNLATPHVKREIAMDYEDRIVFRKIRSKWTRRTRVDFESRKYAEKYVYEIEWEEEDASSAVSRPPVGWDDLLPGGASVQTRWAWGDEEISQIEVSHGWIAYKELSN